jgi:hypothetical protein
MVELELKYAQTAFDVAQTVAKRQLGEGHAEEWLPTKEPADPMVAPPLGTLLSLS